ncbi:MAG: DUF4416 family protein [Nitrospiraceae bacterium]|nr:DUF4416 family protein [Nitrospiraceae bacterium]
MGMIRVPEKVMLFAGVLYCLDEHITAALASLKNEFGGKILHESDASLWHSGYYAGELGCDEVKRKFIFFDALICPGELAAIKLKTNDIEASLSESGKRKVNIDPGYITPARIVLASTKDYAHRVYLQKGIYAEATMLWSRKERRFVPHLFTYSDFMEEKNITIFSQMRDVLQSRLSPASRPFSGCK